MAFSTVFQEAICSVLNSSTHSLTKSVSSQPHLAMCVFNKQHVITSTFIYLSMGRHTHSLTKQEVLDISATSEETGGKLLYRDQAGRTRWAAESGGCLSTLGTRRRGQPCCPQPPRAVGSGHSTAPLSPRRPNAARLLLHSGDLRIHSPHTCRAPAACQGRPCPSRRSVMSTPSYVCGAVSTWSVLLGGQACCVLSEDNNTAGTHRTTTWA